jgi:hydrogenase maturation protein HypF
VALVDHAARVVGSKPVCLSGGVWQNRRLTETTVAGLEAAGHEVFLNQRVPCNDGGISYGQAAVAAAILHDRAARAQAPAVKSRHILHAGR